MSYEDVLQDIAKLSTAKHGTRLVAVSKLQSTTKIRDLIFRGHRLFGENYVQEAADKISELQDSRLEWHFIGGLQKNKVKSVVGIFDLIHSVDSLELAEKISSQAGIKSQKILLQVNLAAEDSKGGFLETDLSIATEKIRNFPNLQVTGLMTMPPLFEDPEKSRPYFQKLRQWAERLALSELSMGTSADYKVALSEGATLIRLGTTLFGERPRKNS